MPTVFITPEPLFHVAGPHLELLRTAGFEVCYPDRPRLDTEEEAVECLALADAVIAGGDPLSDRVLAQLTRLRVIARCGVGFDRVDVPAATRRGIAVAITPQGNREGVAEHAMALLLAVARRVVLHDREVRQGHWGKPQLAPLRGKTLGLVGVGRIGQSLAQRAAAFGLRLLGYDPSADEAAVARVGVTLVDFETLLRSADFVSLHAPLSPQTRGLINARTLGLMKPGALLINTARGGLIVEDDLAAALRSGQLGGAGLDVLVDEPPPPDHPLFALDNVVLSPHIAANDTQSIEDMARDAAQNVVDLYHGRWPADTIVNTELRSAWSWSK